MFVAPFYSTGIFSFMAFTWLLSYTIKRSTANDVSNFGIWNPMRHGLLWPWQWHWTSRANTNPNYPAPPIHPTRSIKWNCIGDHIRRDSHYGPHHPLNGGIGISENIQKSIPKQIYPYWNKWLVNWSHTKSRHVPIVKILQSFGWWNRREWHRTRSLVDWILQK